MEKSHDPREFIRGVQQILINNKIRIGFLFGAGSSMAAPLTDKEGKQIFDEKKKSVPLIPGVWAMTDKIISNVKDKDFQLALEKIKAELEEAENDVSKKKNVFMLENIISTIDQKLRVVGKDKLCGLDKGRLKDLRKFFQNEIKTMVSVHNKEEININSSSTLHSDFARWISG